jgi:hypothetical protein
LEREWKAFLESFEGLQDRALTEPGVAGQWSVRDVLAHVTTWEEEVLKAIPLILEDKPLPRYSDIDAFNAREQHRKRNHSQDQVKQELVATHERLVAFLRGSSEGVYAMENRLLQRLRQDTYSYYRHYREHASQITAWRTEQSL